MKKIVLYYLPVILYAALIFVLSSLEKLPGPEFAFDYFDKLMHFGEYAVFAFLLVRLMKNLMQGIDHASIFQITLFIAIAYASSDEFHQSFVPGRDADLGDLAADVLGILLGISVYIWWLRKKSPTAAGTSARNNRFYGEFKGN